MNIGGSSSASSERCRVAGAAAADGALVDVAAGERKTKVNYYYF